MERPIKTIDLPKDQNGLLLPFSTPKHSYTPIRIGTPIGVRRWTEQEKLQVVLGTGQTFAALSEGLQNLTTIAASERPFAEIRAEMIVLLTSMRRGIANLGNARYNQALYMATIFIIQDGDPNPLHWDLEKAEKIVKDWEEAGVNEQDLFFFAIDTVRGWKKFFQSAKAELDSQEDVLLGISGLKKTEKAS